MTQPQSQSVTTYGCCTLMNNGSRTQNIQYPPMQNELKNFRNSTEFNDLKVSLRRSLKHDGVIHRLKTSVAQMLKSDLTSNPAVLALLTNTNNPGQQKHAYNMLERRIRSETESVLLQKTIKEYMDKHREEIMRRVKIGVRNYRWQQQNKPK